MQSPRGGSFTGCFQMSKEVSVAGVETAKGRVVEDEVRELKVGSMGTDRAFIIGHCSFYSKMGSHCLECKLPKAEVWPGSFLHLLQHLAQGFHLENVKVRFFFLKKICQQRAFSWLVGHSW